MIRENFNKRARMDVLALALLALVKKHFLEFSFLISFLLLVPPVGAATLKVLDLQREGLFLHLPSQRAFAGCQGRCDPCGFVRSSL